MKKAKTVLNIILIIIAASCKKKDDDSPKRLAQINTYNIENITVTSAQLGGNITDDGDSPVTKRGVVWNTNPNPTTANNSTNDGGGAGSFISNLTGLTANTTYYVRAYASNGVGTSYGNELSFTTAAGVANIVFNPGAGVTFNGYTYKSIVLGNGQEWLTENLRTSVYANGDPIPNVTDSEQWGNTTSGAWVYFNNNSQYENPYGKLYNWHAVNDPRDVCPPGWHVPTSAEWSALISYLGGESIAGGRMKITGTQYWLSPNIVATNESGFVGLPGGGRTDINGWFVGLGEHGSWWSSSEYTPVLAWSYYLNHDNGFVSSVEGWKNSGKSIRCIKD